MPEGNYIRLSFSHFDVEPEMLCDHDSLSVYSKDDKLVGEFLSPCSLKQSFRLEKTFKIYNLSEHSLF